MRSGSVTMAAAAVALAVFSPAISRAEAGTDPPAVPASSQVAPPTPTVPLVERRFGVDVADPYRWLEDSVSPDVRAWVRAEDAYARQELAQLPGRDALARRLRELNHVESVSPPLHRGTRWFYLRRRADLDKAILCCRAGSDGGERVLIDTNVPDAHGENVSLGTWSPSRDGTRLAFSLHPHNADEATLYLMDVATSAVSPIDVIPGAKYAEPSWTPAGDGFYYTWLPADSTITPADRPGFAEIRFHRVGDDPRSDRVVRAATGNPELSLSADLSRDGRWLFLSIDHGWSSNEIRFRDMAGADTTWHPLVTGRAARFSVTAWQDRWYVLTNDGAPHYRVFRADPGDPAPEHWTEIVPESPDRVIQGASVLGGRLVISSLRATLSEIAMCGLDGSGERAIALPGPGSAGGVVGNPDESEAYYSFSSFTRPPEVYRLDLDGGASALWSAVHLPIDPVPYVVEQVRYPSKDGTMIPMFIVRRKDAPRAGSTPFLLNGYGGFNIAMRPGFNTNLYVWLEAGGGYALPNLRGGGEYGEEWHRAGMLGRKQNVFDDFIAAGEYLVREGYTRPERLAIEGRSNGGLLVGAALTQRPDLFRAVVCGVPLLDMVRYHLFGEGKTWIPEYGCADREEDFRWLYAYSPYHHVKPGTPYPAVLFYSADHDDRVDPMHARKMAAALQAATTSGRPVLLWVEHDAGHSGSDRVRQAIERATETYGFLMHELGMMVAGSTPAASPAAAPVAAPAAASPAAASPPPRSPQAP